MAVELTDLRYFLAVRQGGSLTAAARALGISQPSLTAAMQRLEKHFGTKLLLRDHRGVRLTITGRALAHDAVEMLGILGRAEQRVAGLQDAEGGRFVIGCNESLGAYFLPKFLRAFFSDHPAIEVSIQNASSASVRESVIDREIDFGLVVNPRPHPDLVLVDLFEDAVDFFHHPEPQAERVRTLSQARAFIERGPLIHAARVTESQTLIARLEQQGCLPGRQIACGDFEIVKSIALAGVGVAVLPRRVAAYGHEGKLVRLHAELPFFPDKVQLIYRADLHKTRSFSVLKDALVARGKELRARAR